jgi:hypothetical protein
VFRVQIVIEKDSIVGISRQKLLRLFDVISHMDEIAFEARREPAVSPLVVVKQKHSNRMALGSYVLESKFSQ